MKFLTGFTSNPKRLFVPISEFEFIGFAVRVRRLASGQSTAQLVCCNSSGPAIARGVASLSSSLSGEGLAKAEGGEGRGAEAAWRSLVLLLVLVLVLEYPGA